MPLNEDVDYISILVDGTPEIMPSTLDAHEQLVQVPSIAQTPLSTPQIPSLVRTEFPTPLPDRLVGNDDPALGQKIFDVAEAQAEPIVEPHSVADNLDREPVSAVARRCVDHAPTLPAALLS